MRMSARFFLYNGKYIKVGDPADCAVRNIHVIKFLTMGFYIAIACVHSLPGIPVTAVVDLLEAAAHHFPRCRFLRALIFSCHNKTSKLSNCILHQFEGLHKLWDSPSVPFFDSQAFYHL